MKIIFEDTQGLSEKDQKFINEIVETSILFFEKDGHVSPVMFLLSSKNKTINLAPFNFETQEEKLFKVAAIKEVIPQLGIDSILMAMESYMTSDEDAEEFMNNRDKYPMLADFPKRKDCIVYSFENSIATWMVSIPVNVGNKEILTDEITFKRVERSDGLLTNFLGLKNILQ